MDHPENSADYRGLSVKPQPGSSPSVNPRLKPRRGHPAHALSACDYADAIIGGDRVMLSRAVTLLESRRADHAQLAQEVLALCMPHSGRSLRIGISGVPGAGKSTMIDALGMHILDSQPDARLAVLAIDPSSERSHGSILGDKTRMEQLVRHPRTFLRPSPAAGSLGGVARKTREAIVLCEAAGYDHIIVETVGVGQSETACQSMVDYFLLLQLAGEGDDLQGIKRGIMEMADGFAVNKCDGDGEASARLAAATIQSIVRFLPLPPGGQRPEVRCVSSLTGTGLPELWQLITEHLVTARHSGHFAQRRAEQNLYWMHETIRERLLGRFYQDDRMRRLVEQASQQLAQNQTTPFAAANELLREFDARQ